MAKSRRYLDVDDDLGLSPSEFILYGLLFMAIPAINVLVSSILYYVWKSQYPKKAGQINMLGFVVFGIHLFIGLLGYAFVNIVLKPAINANQQNPANNVKTLAVEQVFQTPGLIAHWSFDEGTGTETAERTNRLPAAKLSGGVRWVEGIRGKALEFDGKSGFCDLGDSPDLNFAAGQEFSIVGWFKSQSEFATLLSFRNKDDYGPIIDVALSPNPSLNLMATVREDGSNGKPSAEVRLVMLNDGQWHHFFLGRKSDQIFLTLDGQIQGQARGSGWRCLDDEHT